MPKINGQINYARLTVFLLGAILIIRVLGILISPLNLGPDEAQYWRWGQSFQWGYYSKPPLIAWVIGVVTSVLGDSEWAVRLPAPFLHTLAASALFWLARDMYDARTGAYAALGYILMPGIALSAGLLATDGLLLPIWAAALACLWRLRARPESWAYAGALGLAIGLGFLAKYAMVYFLIGLAISAIVDRPTRGALLSRRGVFTALIAFIILIPHIFWSVATEFETLGHTVDNANWSGALFNPENGLKFLVDQMGIAGPIGFLVLLGVVLGRLRKTKQAIGIDPRTVWLIAFTLPALLVIMAQAITSRAHANWAATAYLAGSVLITVWLTRPLGWPRRFWIIAGGAVFCAALTIPDMRLPARIGLGGCLWASIVMFGALTGWKRSGLLWGNFALNSVFALVFMALAAGPANWSQTLGLSEAFKRTRGWQDSTQQIAALAAHHNVSAVLVDERENWHGLDYYGRSGVLPLPLYTWHRNAYPKSYAETFRLAEGHSRPVLIAAKSKFLDNRIDQDFDTVERLGVVDTALGDTTNRRFYIYLATGFHPVARTPKWQRLNPEDF